jgi:beta-galactosidase
MLRLEFYDSRKRLVDGYLLQFAPTQPPDWKTSGQAARIAEQPASLDGSSNIRLLGDNVELAFDRSTGNMSRGIAGRHQVLLAGPELHIMKSGAPLENYPTGWHLTKANYRTENGVAVLEWNGDYGHDFTGGFKISMDDAGHTEFSYRFRHTGGKITTREIGLSFAVPLECDTLNWDRKAEWSYYPADEIGRPHGTASAHARAPQLMPPGERPFAQDDHAWGCNDFRSAKRNIYWASLTDSHEAGIRIVSDGSQHVRATVGPRSISVCALDYYCGAATGTPEWDGAYGVGKVIQTGDVLEGKVRVQLLFPRP